MGVYPTVEYRDVNTGMLLSRESLIYKQAWYEIGTLDYAVYFARLVVADIVHEERTTCWCCSCGDREGSDPYCRNHGFAGQRPCTLHGMPGQPDSDSGVMPMSVQQHREEMTARDPARR